MNRDTKQTSATRGVTTSVGACRQGAHGRLLLAEDDGWQLRQSMVVSRGRWCEQMSHQRLSELTMAENTLIPKTDEIESIEITGISWILIVEKEVRGSGRRETTL